MGDPIKQYQDALREYDKARGEAVRRIRMIESVSSALQNSLSAFLFRNYSLPTATRETYHSDRGAFDMKQWPNSDSLREILTNWYTAFDNLRKTWGAIPENDRIGLKAPPQKMEST